MKERHYQYMANFVASYSAQSIMLKVGDVIQIKDELNNSTTRYKIFDFDFNAVIITWYQDETRHVFLDALEEE